MSNEVAVAESETFETDIAIIGMSGRFPKSRNLDEWWKHLRSGVELVSFFSEEELLAAGVPPELIANDHYVRAGSVLEDAALFDASFFGFNPREAEIIDPQDRVFLESSHEALEHAGYMADNYPGRIGVYAGESMNTYLLNNIASNRSVLDSVGGYQTMTGNDKDFLPTRVSYKLDLRGPSVNVQTACSTSLVAVHMACQSLLNGECDIALAGGVSVQPPQGAGYMYQEEMILSPDGHCRTFDAKAKGTTGGTGVGIVVLKRLDAALADGDTIHAVVRGSAINNDGLRKVGYTAPSIEGQAEVIAEAQAMARITADTITYIEAHGTATPLGDPIEIAALTQAFRATTKQKGYCAIGSVKSNLGHLDAAAGVTGLLKTVLQLKHGEIAPSLHFESPNPQIDFASSPFFVNTELRQWKSNGVPRRAGVSSFGIGGTNAHVVIEEAPKVADSSETPRGWQLLTVSAKTEAALERASEDLATYLRENPETRLADVAFTQHVGRTAYDYRRTVVCRNNQDAVEALEKREAYRCSSGRKDTIERSAVFMFTGQGAQYVSMGRELYDKEPTFRTEVDRCAELLKPHLGCDLREVIYPAAGATEESSARLSQTAMTQPALFVIEYALAKLWMEWGVRPSAMIGHSIGEYVAACLSEVMTLEDALRAVAMRGKLMQSLPGGSMTAVPLAEAEVVSLLEPGLSLATINGPQMCVVSGATDAVAKFEEKLTGTGVNCRRLHTSHAFHSSMMDDIIGPFTELMRHVLLKAPRIPYISNVTGTWIKAEEATDPQYWARHLRQAVRFSDGIQELLREPQRVLIEVGPGQTLSSLVKPQLGQAGKSGEAIVINSLRHAQDQKPDVAFMLNTLGRLWVAGLRPDWKGFHQHETRRRIPIPTYPFERQRYWIEPNSQMGESQTARTVLTSKKQDIAEWFYVPSWKRSTPLDTLRKENLNNENARWLIFADKCGIADQISRELIGHNQDVVRVEPESGFASDGESHYKIDPQRTEDYDSLFKELSEKGRLPQMILHMWGVTPPESSTDSQPHRDLGLYSLIYLTQAIGNHSATDEIQLAVVTNGVQDVTGDEELNPEKSLILGACLVIPQEYANITCRRIDVVVPETEPARKHLSEQLIAELTAKPGDVITAYRSNQRWVQAFEAVRLDEATLGGSCLKDEGVYLITGGLGGIGLVLSEYLSQNFKAKLILTGRSTLPERSEWANWLVTHSEGDDLSLKIQKVQALESLGSEVLVVSADTANVDEMRTAIVEAKKLFGRIDGVIHAAGTGYPRQIRDHSQATVEPVLAAKVKGTQVLDDLFKDEGVNFIALCSSISAFMGGPNQIDYCAANAYLDTYARQNLRRQGHPRVISINWDRWQEVGMAANPANISAFSEAQQKEYKRAILSAEGAEAFSRVMRTTLPQVIVHTSDLESRVAAATKLDEARAARQASATVAVTLHPRPTMQNTYVEPRTDFERAIVDMWQGLLGIEQIGIHDNFFELGGHSLLATQFISRVRETFGVEMSLRTLFESSTIAELSEVIVAAEAQPGQVSKIAQVLMMVESMSAEDVNRTLQEKNVTVN